jgi:hypothetical protein
MSDGEAMQDALASFDGNAIISYLAIARYKGPADSFGMRLSQNPILADHYAAYRQYTSLGAVMQIEGYPMLRAAAMRMIQTGEVSFGKDTKKLAEVGRLLNSAEKNSPHVQAIEGQQLVIGLMQGILQKENPGGPVSPLPTKSPRFILAQGLVDGRDQLVAKIQKQYKISDRTFAWIQLRAYSANKQWPKLLELSRRSQPLPWETYAEVCAQAGRREEAIAFLKKISSSEQRLSLFQQFEYWREAAGAAAECKNMQLYNELNHRAQMEGDE